MDRTPAVNRVHLQKKINSSGLQQLIEETRQLIDTKVSSKHANQEDIEGLKDDAYIKHILTICQTRVDVLEDLFKDQLAFIWFIPETQEIISSLSTITDPEKAQALLTEAVENLDQTQFEDTNSLSTVLKTVVKKNKLGMKPFMTSMRVALTGLKEGPSVAEILSILGKQTSLQRLGISKKALEDNSLSKVSQ